MTASIHQTQVNLDGLLEVLGKNLYSTPSVTLRELIQNAHDACIRRTIESGEEHFYKISLLCEDNDTLIIEDNGSGLTEDEIRDYLATIGSGYTRVLRDKLSSEDMIGYFGLGFLSAYVVAEKVEVHTCSFKTPNKAWRFSSAGGKSFTVSPAEQQPVGTRVRLCLKSSFHALACSETVANLVRRYCCLLAIPIHINHQAEPTNTLQPPWLDAQAESPLALLKKRVEFAELFDEQFSVLACIPILENDLGLKGLIWIQDGSSYGSLDNRKVSVFVRNMFITDKDRELLPRWASFVGAVVECGKFLPTANRESIQENEVYAAACNIIRESLISGLQSMALSQAEVWSRVLACHGQALLGAAVASDALFEVCKKTLKVATSIGDETLPKLLKHCSGKIHIKGEVSTSTDEVLLRAQGIPVVKGYMFAAFAFCSRFAESENAQLINLGSKNDRSKLFEAIDDLSPPQVKRLTALFAAEGEDLVFTRFHPNTVPLVYVVREEILQKQRIESDQAAKRISRAALSLARLQTAQVKNKNARVLYLNITHPVVRVLGERELPQAEQIAKLLSAFMLGLLGDLDEEQKLLSALNLFNQSLLALMGEQ